MTCLTTAYSGRRFALPLMPSVGLVRQIGEIHEGLV
jgi:hypothetical protein